MPAPDPQSLRSRCDRLVGRRAGLQADRDRLLARAAQLKSQLELAPKIEEALQKLSNDLFAGITTTLEKHLSQALREILEQPITLRIHRQIERGMLTIDFAIERDGNSEDIMLGQGGSVANILSVGLRLYSMTQLDPKRHRKVLVLDEQDCWLAPELVPRLMRVIAQAARQLKLQVIVISHHDVSLFRPHAQRILRLTPAQDGVRVEEVPT